MRIKTVGINIATFIGLLVVLSATCGAPKRPASLGVGKEALDEQAI